jgi:hypothetical protein
MRLTLAVAFKNKHGYDLQMLCVLALDPLTMLRMIFLLPMFNNKLGKEIDMP